jgi:Flavoprotein
MGDVRDRRAVRDEVPRRRPPRGPDRPPVRCDYKRPDEADVLPPPDAFVVAPATFNTINKLAAGISGTLALGFLNEAVGTGLPVIAVPFPNQMLARHPAFAPARSPACLTAARPCSCQGRHPPDAPR